MHCRLLSRSSGLYSLDFSSDPSPSVVPTRNATRHGQMSPGGGGANILSHFLEPLLLSVIGLLKLLENFSLCFSYNN